MSNLDGNAIAPSQGVTMTDEMEVEASVQQKLAKGV